MILDYVSAEHDINAYVNLVRPGGNRTLVGGHQKSPCLCRPSLLFSATNP